jgi:hypothetical protein
MEIVDLATVAMNLRRNGMFARNLGQDGITIWVGPHGSYVSAAELRSMAVHLSPQELYDELRARVAAGPTRVT